MPVPGEDLLIENRQAEYIEHLQAEVERLKSSRGRWRERCIERGRQLEITRDALQNAIYAAWDGPPEPVGTGCLETYSGWRSRLEEECKAVLREEKSK